MKILTYLILLCVPSAACAETLKLEQLSNSVCRVISKSYTDTGYGSGTFFMEDENYYYVLTNGHVVGKANSLAIQFVKAGEYLPEVSAKLKWAHWVYNTSIDIAILSVSKANVKDIRPRIIPLANYNTAVPKGTLVFGAGFPASRWLQSWECKIANNRGNIYDITMPPEGGQSGSGVLMNINDNTYIIGIVTWRYEEEGNNHGGAVSISRIREVFRGIAKPDEVSSKICSSETVCNSCGRVKDEHILIYDKNTNQPVLKNGNPLLYCPDAQFVLLEGQAACQWKLRPLPPGVQPPNQNIPRRPPGQGPFGELPPGLVEPPQQPTEPPVPVPDNSEEIKKLKEQLVKAQAEVAELGKTAESLRGTISQLMNENKSLSADLSNCHKNDIKHSEEFSKMISEKNIRIAELEEKIKMADVPNSGLGSQVELWKAEVLKLKIEIEEQIDNVASKDRKISLLESKLATAEKELERLTSAKTVIENELKGVQAANSDLSSQNKESKSRVEDLLKEIDKLKDGIEPDALDNPVTNGKNTKVVLALVLGFILSRLAPFIKAKFGTVLGTIIVKVLEKGGKKVLSVNPQPVEQQKPTDTKTVLTSISEEQAGLPTSSQIKQFIQMKAKDGEDIDRLAIFGILYRQAVEKLKEGYFRTDNDVPILSQEKVAQKVEDWVINEFFHTTTREQLMTQDDLHREAMYGFLYKQAFDALRQGKFGNGVLNHVEIANAVEKWVKREYLNRINVRM